MSDPVIQYWTSSDSIDLAWREFAPAAETGPPVILLHGLFSDGVVNWIKFGHAAKLVALGRRVLIPDLRAHGLSGKPHDAVHYPHGILGRDLQEFVSRLALVDYDLVGFSLGGRTVVQGVGHGLKPRRAVLAGVGLEGLIAWAARRTFFLEAIAQFDTASRGDPHWLAIQFMKTMKIDKLAAVPLLESFEAPPEGWLSAFTMPTLVLCGSADQDNGRGSDLATALPNAEFVETPGTHMSSVTQPAMGDAIADFLR